MGTIGEANRDIRQETVVLRGVEDKEQWLRANIDDFAADGKVLVFALSKAATEHLSDLLKRWFIQRQLDIQVY